MRLQKRNILVPIDSNNNKLIQTIRKFSNENDTIFLINIYKSESILESLIETSEKDILQDHENQEGNSVFILEECKNQLKGFNVEWFSLCGDAKYVIEEMIMKLKPDMVIMGKSKLLIGSITNYVIKHSSVPVMLVSL
jgi:nucleotide-binding universal stress UspA family protein